MGYRIMQKFWLDLDKPDHEEVNNIIFNFKSARTYSKAIRDGLRLIADLHTGRLDVLFELFPWVRAEFLEYMASVQPQQSQTERIAEHLARIEKLLASDKSVTPALAGEGRGEPKKMQIGQVAAPTFDDDADVLVISKAKASGNAAQNFLNSAFNLIQ